MSMGSSAMRVMLAPKPSCGLVWQPPRLCPPESHCVAHFGPRHSSRAYRISHPQWDGFIHPHLIRIPGECPPPPPTPTPSPLPLQESMATLSFELPTEALGGGEGEDGINEMMSMGEKHQNPEDLLEDGSDDGLVLKAIFAKLRGKQYLMDPRIANHERLCQSPSNGYFSARALAKFFDTLKFVLSPGRLEDVAAVQGTDSSLIQNLFGDGKSATWGLGLQVGAGPAIPLPPCHTCSCACRGCAPSIPLPLPLPAPLPTPAPAPAPAPAHAVTTSSPAHLCPCPRPAPACQCSCPCPLARTSVPPLLPEGLVVQRSCT